MALARSASPLDEVRRLRAQMDQVQRRRVDVAVLPVADPLASLFPDGGLRQGAVYSWDGSTSLLLALMAVPSQAGSWCAAVGFPDLGVEAAEDFGVVLERLVLIPEPGRRWLPVASALAEVVPVIAVRAANRVSDAEMSRMGARLRDRGGVLLVAGPWAGAEAELRVERSVWHGLGDGHGLLSSRVATVAASGRRTPFTRRADVQLPGPGGMIAATNPVSAHHPADRPLRQVRPLRAVG